MLALWNGAWENDNDVVLHFPEVVVLGRVDPQGSLLETRLQALLAATVANFKRLGVLDAFGASSTVAAAALIRLFSPVQATIEGHRRPRLGHAEPI